MPSPFVFAWIVRGVAARSPCPCRCSGGDRARVPHASSFMTVIVGAILAFEIWFLPVRSPVVKELFTARSERG